MNKLVPLRNCPVGLFICNDVLCVKTEYGNEAYIISSGEYFWGGAKTKQQIGDVLVLPVPNKEIYYLERKYAKKYKLNTDLLKLKRGDENNE